jgi:hypothetical protein
MAGKPQRVPEKRFSRPGLASPVLRKPETAIVATVGVNPSSCEFVPGRGWDALATPRDWKLCLKNYFNHAVPPHVWSGPWRIGLALLDCSYEAGTAAHFDVSYRPTTGMLTNQNTDRPEFRMMVEHDVQWLFKLLPRCPKLRVLLSMGPIIGANQEPASLTGFLHEFAPRHGFKVIHNEGFWEFWHEESRKVLVIHEADTPGEKCITCRVVKNLHAHRDELRQRMAQSGDPLKEANPLLVKSLRWTHGG